MADLTVTRRTLLEMGAGAGVVLAAAKMGLLSVDRAFAQAAGDVAMADLLADNALPDIWQGKADAPVSIVEYASMTCPHCAHFHETTYPVLKSKYIDTGKVRFVLREFPFDPIATAAFMLARCSDDKRDAVAGLLFAQQRNWAYTDKPLQGLVATLKQTGMSQERFDSCLKDEALYMNINAVRDRATQKFGVNATPTFFINGKRVNGDLTPEELDKQLTPLLKS